MQTITALKSGHEAETGGPFGEAKELALVAQLLKISDAEFDQFDRFLEGVITEGEKLQAVPEKQGAGEEALKKKKRKKGLCAKLKKWIAGKSFSARQFVRLAGEAGKKLAAIPLDPSSTVGRLG